MARLPLNKSELAKKKHELATYRRFLPSLDLKRRQLLAERNRARKERDDLRRQREQHRARIAELVPMLSNHRITVEGLVSVTEVKLGEANIVGVRVPTFEDIHFEVAAYGMLTKPHWVDRVVELLREAARLQVREQVAERRLALLDEGVTKVTQRVNLFEKVLIPRTESAIRGIQIALADAERASVVRSKIAKSRHAGAESGEVGP